MYDSIYTTLLDIVKRFLLIAPERGGAGAGGRPLGFMICDFLWLSHELTISAVFTEKTSIESVARCGRICAALRHRVSRIENRASSIQHRETTIFPLWGAWLLTFRPGCNIRYRSVSLRSFRRAGAAGSCAAGDAWDWVSMKFYTEGDF